MSSQQVGLHPDLIVSVAEKSCLETWKLTGPQLLDFVPSSEYWLIVPDDQVQLFAENSPKEFTVFPESEFILVFSEKFSRCEGVALPARRGWYLQQLIKLAALYRASQLGRIVIWDADTVPLREISFFDSQGQCRYYFGTEYHLPYFENIDGLLGLDKAHPNSFVAQNFPIRGSQVRDFFAYIEERHQTEWWNAVIDSIDFNEASGFSEYEALGTFVSSLNTGSLATQSGMWSREGKQTWVSRYMRSRTGPLSKYDFVAVERWTQNRWGLPFLFGIIRGLSERIEGVYARVLKLFGFPTASSRLENHLARIFEAAGGIDVVQIGANDGIQSDPLRRFLQSPGNFSARLVEPIPHYAQELKRLYMDRLDVEIIDCAAGSEDSMMEIFHIEPSKALQMNGDGPQNNWALGQGSSSRATVVYWIYKNSWRGDSYAERIPEWIDSIEKLQVRVVQTQELICDADRTLLVVDVQGMEEEVVRGLSRDNVPRWVLLEEDLGKKAARQLLVGWGYREVFSRNDTLFELNQAHR
jgi:FkbM family methyltransferase